MTAQRHSFSRELLRALTQRSQKLAAKLCAGLRRVLGYRERGAPVVEACPKLLVTEEPSMLTLRLPDGSTKQVAEGTRPREVAESIGKRLAQAAVAAKVNGTVVDLERELTAGNGDIPFQILTEKDSEALAVL